ncbi:MAG: low temperature requirement protein A [Candidatus Magnetobacterium sp. LHC-1]|uniref:Low temperature requirement protein A n=1 Tax=Candidatus Magnetobacterium casense TaxID=1455061 RepID=A0ABS6S0C2_9BACT|nr:low temperature requirement protein A [Candidatus Magnetobacterium casensis]MBF0608337.1 low temperature requirement protein A [Nitrospirota bacterium]MBV6342299.1 low temperature requirement protein A [Candidatus Magnetobacterium casensis]
MKTNIWQPPQLRAGAHTGEEERHATWFELFYDLIFVVVVAQLADFLKHHLSMTGFAQYIFLFIPVWWSWVGATFYATRFDTDDMGHRMLTILQMFAVMAMAISASNGFGKSSVAFALSYVAVRMVLMVQYLRAMYYVKDAGVLIKGYMLGFSIAAAIWFVSVFVPVPYRFILWGIAIIVDYATPLILGKVQVEFPPHLMHLPERFGLFIIIVLGESISGVVRGIYNLSWTPASLATAIAGLSIVISLWLMYFENPDSTDMWDKLEERLFHTYNLWIYSHLPLAIFITASAVGVELIISSSANPTLNPTLSDSIRWVFCGSVICCLLTLWTVRFASTTIVSKTKRDPDILRLITALTILILAFAGKQLSHLTIIAIVAVMCVVVVAVDLYKQSS